jgi:hypothetical protein
MGSGCNSLQWVKHYNSCKRKKNAKGFCCQICLQHLNPKILFSFYSCISLGLWNKRKQIFWMRWMNLCTRDERQNNVEKHLKNATHNTRGHRKEHHNWRLLSIPQLHQQKYGEFCLWLFEKICFLLWCVWLMYTKICGFVWSIFADAKGTT